VRSQAVPNAAVEDREFRRGAQALGQAGTLLPQLDVLLLLALGGAAFLLLLALPRVGWHQPLRLHSASDTGILLQPEAVTIRRLPGTVQPCKSLFQKAEKRCLEL